MLVCGNYLIKSRLANHVYIILKEKQSDDVFQNKRVKMDNKKSKNVFCEFLDGR